MQSKTATIEIKDFQLQLMTFSKSGMKEVQTKNLNERAE